VVGSGAGATEVVLVVGSGAGATEVVLVVGSGAGAAFEEELAGAMDVFTDTLVEEAGPDHQWVRVRPPLLYAFAAWKNCAAEELATVEVGSTQRVVVVRTVSMTSWVLVIMTTSRFSSGTATARAERAATRMAAFFILNCLDAVKLADKFWIDCMFL